MATSTETEGTIGPWALPSPEAVKRDVLREWWKLVRRHPNYLLEPSGVDAAVKLLTFLLEPKEKPLPSEGDKATIEAVQAQLNLIETIFETKFGIHITEAPGRAPRGER